MTAKLSRRRLLSLGGATIAGAFSAECLGYAGQPDGPQAEANDRPYRFSLPDAGRVRAVRSTQIAASPLSVGFEVLDRRCFEPEKTYQHLAVLGVKWARCQTGWNRCEQKPGQFDFAWLEAVVEALLEIGIQPWFNVGYDNKLYFPEKPDEQSVGWAPVFQAEQQAAWLRFVGQLARHFRGRVRHWEIWNEPNIPAFWKPHKPNPADYVKLVRITAAEIRQRVPDAVIIGGAFAGIPLSFVEGCLEAGMAELVDRISYHPYRAIPEAGYETELAKLRQTIARYNSRILLWQGENGCPSKGGKDSMGALANLPWNETRQAKWLLRRILTDLRLGVELTSYFHTVDLRGYRTGTNYKGLLRGEDYRPKPAYFAFQCLCALLDAQTTRADLRPEITTPKPETTAAEKSPLVHAAFLRRGHPLFAWWAAVSLFEPWPRRQITLRLVLPSGATLKQPVLVDPLSARLYRLEQARIEPPTVLAPELPLLEYPLILTDAGALP